MEISHIKSLESLDLSYSAFDSIWSLRFPSTDLGFVVGNLSGLRELILDGVELSSPAPQTLGFVVGNQQKLANPALQNPRSKVHGVSPRHKEIGAVIVEQDP